MNCSKRYITIFGIVAGMGILAAGLLVLLIDPFFHYHMPWFGLKPVINDEIYQNPGLAKHASYDSIIIGSSMTENFDAAWFDEAYDICHYKTCHHTNNPATDSWEHCCPP